MSRARRMSPGEREAHRALVNYWIKVVAATFVDDGDGTALEEVVREAAGPRAQVRITTPLMPDEEQGLRRALDHLEHHRIVEIGLNLVACSLLVRWLAEASGRSATEILDRLRAELSGPPVLDRLRG